MAATLADIQRKYGESVYPLYKEQMHEPYMENPRGFGYMGAVLYDELDDKIQCAECGNWFKALGRHVVSEHDFEDIRQYKDRHNLLYKTALVSMDLSRIHSDSAKRHYPRNNKLSRIGNVEGKGIRKLRATAKITYKKTQMKNKFALCDAQIAARLVVVRDMAEIEDINELRSEHVRRHDHNLYIHLREKYGSVGKSCDALGLIQSRKDKYEDSDLVARLRKFVMQKKRIPGREDMRSGLLPNDKVFTRVFGSWRRAKMMAGLDQLLKEVKNK